MQLVHEIETEQASSHTGNAKLNYCFECLLIVSFAWGLVKEKI